MKRTYNIFLCVMILLFSVQVITGGLTFLKKGNALGYFTPIQDWNEESSEEDETRNFEDDLEIYSGYSLTIESMSRSRVIYFPASDLKEPIAEIIPPPPQV